MFVKVRVEIDSTARENFCFDNCVAKVARDGGEVVVGWRKTPAAGGGLPFFSLDHHAVWKNPSGDLVDISPRVAVTYGRAVVIQDQEIEFCPDPEATFTEGKKARDSQYIFEGEDRWGLLQQACDWANQSAAHIAANDLQKANYSDSKAKELLNQHAKRLRRG